MLCMPKPILIRTHSVAVTCSKGKERKKGGVGTKRIRGRTRGQSALAAHPLQFPVIFQNTICCLLHSAFTRINNHCGDDQQDGSPCC